jgi:Xaa-Pro dipeptidase
MQQIDYQQRVKALAASLKTAGVAAYVGTRQASLHYLYGAFMPWRGAVIVTSDGACEVVYWAMDAARVKEEGAGFPLHTFTFADFPSQISDRLKAHGCERGTLGLDLMHPGAAQVAPGMLTAHEYFQLQEALPQAKLVNGVQFIDDLMLIKSPAEIERLRLAAHVSDVGFRAGYDAIAEGVTENHVAGAIEAAIRDCGSVWSWAVTGGTEVGSGLRTGYHLGVTQQASDKKIGRNEFVILDLHPMLNLYLADTAIPVFFGTPNTAQKRLIDCWEEVAQTMLDSLKPGKRVADCAAEGIKVFEKRGMAEYGLPLFGHGLGTCARTRPFLNLRSDDIVQENMVIALGTHLYHPEIGGMRLEYPILIGPHGSEPLVDTPAKVQFKRD